MKIKLFFKQTIMNGAAVCVYKSVQHEECTMERHTWTHHIITRSQDGTAAFLSYSSLFDSVEKLPCLLIISIPLQFLSKKKKKHNGS